MGNVRIDELKNDLCIGNLGEYFCDYSDGYIADIITEIADNHIAIYYKDTILFRIYDYLQHDLEIAEITEKQQAEIEALNIEDNNEQLENLLQQAENIVKNED